MTTLSTSLVHREYKNDIKIERKDNSWTELGKRLAVNSVPFLSLYKPFSYPVMIGTSALRVYSAVSNLVASSQNPWKNVSYDLMQTTIAVTALAFTIFAFPIGMLITTGHDLMNETIQLGYNVYGGQYVQVFENMAHIASSGLYAAVLLTGFGTVQVVIASLSAQIALGLYHAVKEFNKGNNVEGLAHLGMAAVRSMQLAQVIEAAKPLPAPTQYHSKIKSMYGQDWNNITVLLEDGTKWQISGRYLYNWRQGDHVDVLMKDGQWVFINSTRSNMGYNDFYNAKKA